MAFNKAKQLIEQANEAEYTYSRIMEEGREYYDEEELEAREDEAYRDYWKAIDRLADHLKVIIVGMDKKAAWAMAKDRRNEMLTLFNSAI